MHAYTYTFISFIISFMSFVVSYSFLVDIVKPLWGKKFCLRQRNNGFIVHFNKTLLESDDSP